MITHKVVRTSGSTTISEMKSFWFKDQASTPGSLFFNAIAREIRFSYYYSAQSDVVSIGEELQYWQVSDLNKKFQEVSGYTAQRLMGYFYVADVQAKKGVCTVIAYDEMLKLNVNYSKKLKEIQGNFPMSMKTLVTNAVSYAGLTLNVPSYTPLDFVDMASVNAFYSDSITVCDLVKWFAAFRGYSGIRIGNNHNIEFVSYGTLASSDSISDPPLNYIICPTDQETYLDPDDSHNVLTNVFYKMDGLEIVDIDQPMIDCVQVYKSNGELFSSYSSGTENAIFTIYGNPLIDNAIDTFNLRSGVSNSIYNAIHRIQLNKTISVDLFPFRCYTKTGYFTYIVDESGTIMKFPVMSTEWSDDKVTVESFGQITSSGNGNDADENATILSTSLNDLISNLKKSIWETAYPVGSIYMSTNSTSPEDLFGGTWVQLEDRFLLGAGSDYTAGDTGGEATHTLTIAEMPTHTHIQDQHRHTSGFRNNISNGTGGARRGGPYAPSADNDGEAYTEYATATNQNTGGDGAHNNMPPYLVVFMWQRVS